MELEDFELAGNSLEIVKYPHPMLKTCTEKVVEFDEDLRQLAHQMAVTMYREPGCGLSANQVGINKRLFVADTGCRFVEDREGNFQPTNPNPRVFVNPVFTNESGEVEFEEGCLSFPGLAVKVKRSEKLTISFQHIDGTHHSYEVHGNTADCLQHENDHLDGITFLDRLSPLKRQMAIRKFFKMKKKR